jgi:glutathione S-transferase
MGDAPSVLDIAWFIYAHRLSLAGYPLERLHPRVFAWNKKLGARPEFAKEIAVAPEVEACMDAARRAQVQAGKTLEIVAGF